MTTFTSAVQPSLNYRSTAELLGSTVVRPFVVKTSTACMPGTCWGRYINVAVIKTTDGKSPKMISTRARGVVRIVESWGPCHVGKTDRAADARALASAERLAWRLNSEHWGCPV